MSLVGNFHSTPFPQHIRFSEVLLRLTRAYLTLESSFPPPIPLLGNATMGSKCIGLTAHRPSRRHLKYEAYWMFEAAKAGCISCVTQCLTERQISPCVTSLTEKSTVLDSARFGSAQGITTTENLVAYLEHMTPPIPEHTQPAHGRAHSENGKRASDLKLTHLLGDIGSAPSTGCSKLRRMDVWAVYVGV